MEKFALPIRDAIDAAKRYQESQGAQFETYAVQRIRGGEPVARTTTDAALLPDGRVLIPAGFPAGQNTSETYDPATNQYVYVFNGQTLDGIPTVADDSGLEVTALAGRPGVRSKRWSGRTDWPSTCHPPTAGRKTAQKSTPTKRR